MIKIFKSFIYPIRYLFTKLLLKELITETHINIAANYIYTQGIEGDYLEFGCFKGESFINAYKNIKIAEKDWTSIKRASKAYSKKKFDPFCRRDRIEFKIDDILIETTIGQLNFFKWAIENMILEYVVINKKDIEKDMNDSLQISKKLHKKNDERKKRQELSLSASRGLNKHHGNIIICFD